MCLIYTFSLFFFGSCIYQIFLTVVAYYWHSRLRFVCDLHYFADRPNLYAYEPAYCPESLGTEQPSVSWCAFVSHARWKLCRSLHKFFATSNHHWHVYTNLMFAEVSSSRYITLYSVINSAIWKANIWHQRRYDASPGHLPLMVSSP